MLYVHPSLTIWWGTNLMWAPVITRLRGDMRPTYHRSAGLRGSGKRHLKWAHISSLGSIPCLTPSSMAHKFNDFILKKKLDTRSNSPVHLDQWKLNVSNVSGGSMCVDGSDGSSSWPHYVALSVILWGIDAHEYFPTRNIDVQPSLSIRWGTRKLHGFPSLHVVTWLFFSAHEHSSFANDHIWLFLFCTQIFPIMYMSLTLWWGMGAHEHSSYICACVCSYLICLVNNITGSILIWKTAHFCVLYLKSSEVSSVLADPTS